MSKIQRKLTRLGFQRGLIWNEYKTAVRSNKSLSILNGQEEREHVPLNSEGRWWGERGS